MQFFFKMIFIVLFLKSLHIFFVKKNLIYKEFSSFKVIKVLACHRLCDSVAGLSTSKCVLRVIKDKNVGEFVVRIFHEMRLTESLRLSRWPISVLFFDSQHL